MSGEVNAGELVAHLGLKVDLKGFNQAIKNFNKLGEHIKRIGEAFMVFEGLRVLHDWIEETTEAAVGFKHLAERLGTSTAAVQQLGYAADVTGASAESVQTALQRLQLGMEHAAQTGQGPLTDALSKLNIPMAAFKKLKPDEQFARLADGFKNAGPIVNKTALAMELFGRNAGPRLIPLLNKGSEGLKELREEFEATGAELDDNTIERFEQLEIQQKKLGYVWKGLKSEAVGALLPALTDMASGVMTWVRANRELIKSALEKIIKGVAVALKVLGSIFSVVISIVKELVLNWKSLALAAGVVAVAMIYLKREAVMAGFATARAWIAAAAPFLIIVAIIAALYLVIQDLYVWAEGGDSVFKRLYEAAVRYFGDTGIGKAIGWVIDKAKELFHFLEEKIKWLEGKAMKLADNAATGRQFIRNRDRIMHENPTDKTGRRLTAAEIDALAWQDAKNDVGTSAALSDISSDANVARGEAINTRNAMAAEWAAISLRPVQQHEINSLIQHNQVTIHAVEATADKIGTHLEKVLDGWWEKQARTTKAATTTGARSK